MDISKLKTIDDIINYAADKEQEASDLYKDLADRTTRTGVKEMFMDLSKQEAGHKVKVLSLKKGGLPMKPVAQVADLKISDYLTSETVGPKSSYQDILIFAMKREEASVGLYTALAGVATDGKAKGVLLALADEERKHKLRIETEYDENVLKEN